MKRYSKYLTLIIFIILIGIINKNIEAREWVIPGFEGQVLDVTTGAPVENALVQAIWHSEGISFSLISESGEGLSSTKEIVTDKEGKFKLKSKINIPIIDDFNGVSIEITHPLYVNKYELVYGSGVTTKDKVQSDGTIRYDIKLVGVEEKYLKPFRNKKDYDGSLTSFLGTINGEWLKKIKENNNLKYDLDKILCEWKRLAQELSPKGSNQEPYIWKEIERLEKEFMKLKQEGY